MKYLGNNIFKLTAWDKAKKVILRSYYPLCLIPYIYLLIKHPFYCIVSSFLLTFIGSFFVLFAVWQKENTSKIKWAMYMTFAPGFIMLILSPALFLQKVSEIIQNSP
jgi:hypothetical protein